ncbi:tripartite tricarboxylate transporter substrate binding protein [Pusillimonas sp. SM2304]|uniref:Bug family tripartite tricarboxylate transporter substrate binding protein n=1 Tax=Pusillimonas sp. SM2304 TaxID=3073241 RepID=UPI002874A38C|nr:tripartite tricarboxylate transporter substrate binding protein [Pusillimonas sp. SM2304]MDS1139028.1 tripartite tricarboxylate transporter substrate binding protein [Pusillimonas sp. SM2304]
MSIIRRVVPLFMGAALALSTLQPAYAQAAYPDKPVRLIVPWAPGGATDVIARLVGQKLAERLGQPVVIENKAGAGGNIGTAAFVREKADGYTLLMTTSSTHGINSHLYSRPGFDVEKDFANVAFVGSIPNVLEVPAKSQFDTAQQLLDYAREHPGKLNYGSAGVGSSQHLAAAQLIHSAGIDITHIPYKGSGPAVSDLLGANLDFMLDTGSLGQVKGGALKALAVASKTRLKELPDVPTFDEVGLKDMYAAAWYGVATHAGVPEDIVQKLNQEINGILEQPDMVARLESMGVQVGPLRKPKELDAFVKEEGVRFKALVEMSGAVME